MLPVAVDAMGGDNAPEAIIEGAVQAHEAGTPIVLVGRPDVIGTDHGLPVIEASEVIAMDADGAKSVRTMKDASLPIAAKAVRDGEAPLTAGRDVIAQMEAIDSVYRAAGLPVRGAGP